MMWCYVDEMSLNVFDRDVCYVNGFDPGLFADSTFLGKHRCEYLGVSTVKPG